MRSRIEWLMPALLLSCGMHAFGQSGPDKDQKADSPPPGEKPSPRTIEQLSLEEMLVLALKNNPDLVVAEAKLREAEAEYKRTRLKLAQKLVAMRAHVDAATKTYDEAKNRYQRMKELFEKHAVSAEELAGAELTLLRFKAELAEVKAEIPYLIGQVSQEADNDAANSGGTRRETFRLDKFSSDSRPVPLRLDIKVPRGSEADKLRKALDTPVTFVWSDPKTTLQDIADAFAKVAGVTFLVKDGAEQIPEFRVGRVPLGAAIQALEDAVPGVHFTVRDYGILVTYKTQLPANALSVHDFWKSDPPKE
jgi:multidrug efflux pump subunit AcrA (membrane-fusion protein)